MSGRKRHVLVDTPGLLLKVVVHLADLHDRLGVKLVLGALGTDLPCLQHIWRIKAMPVLPVLCASGHASIWASSWNRLSLVAQPEAVLPRSSGRYGLQPGFHVLPRRSRG